MHNVDLSMVRFVWTIHSVKQLGQLRIIYTFISQGDQ